MFPFYGENNENNIQKENKEVNQINDTNIISGGNNEIKIIIAAKEVDVVDGYAEKLI